MFAVCPLSQVPVRVQSKDASEMVSQVLFGEMVEVLEKRGKNWLKIRCTWDNLVGWCRSNQLKILTPAEREIAQEDWARALDLCQPVMGENHHFPVPFGSVLPQYDGMRLKIGDEFFTFNGQALMKSDLRKDTEFLVKIAKRLLFAPELSGGRSPFGIDSAGLMQVIFGFVGKSLPRTAAEQVFTGEDVDFVEQSRVGDLAFFEDKKGIIAHVGLILGEGLLIHCNGMVKTDRFDHFGVFDGNSRRYAFKLRVIKRVFTFTEKDNTGNEIQGDLNTEQEKLLSYH
ncbi:MAG: C40 family peptidase [Saprospiraceae bacterium]|nr:C40 family peptidase [Saprospiraceae bacterium]